MGSSITFPARTGIPDGAPRVLLQSAISFILAGGTAGGSSNQFTMGNNGALSTLPVLPTTYSGGAFIYMPANAIFAGSAAGWYWFVASATTAGTVYNNAYTGGDPKAAVPATPTPFVSTGPGLVTQTIGAQITAQQIIVPGGSMGPNGSVEGIATWLNNASAGTKTIGIQFDGASLQVWQQTLSTPGVRYDNRFGFTNTNSQSGQAVVSASYSGGFSGVAVADTLASINTATDRVLSTTLQLAAATDFAICRYLRAEVRYGA